MARSLSSNNPDSPLLTPGQQFKHFIAFWLPQWRRLSLYTIGLCFGLFVMYVVGIWAIGSYRVLSDNPTVWHSSIERLNAEDIIKPIKEAPPTLFVGSSSIRLFNNIENIFPEHHIIKKGFGGAKINDVAHYKEDIIFQYNPTLIVLYIGINDILYRRFNDISELANDVFLLMNNIQERLPSANLVVLAVRPLSNPNHTKNINAYNLHLAQYASRHPKVYFMDANAALTNPDGLPNTELLMWDELHLNPQGYEAWGKQINAHLHSLRLIQ